MTDLEQKRIFLVATGNDQLAEYLENRISKGVRQTTIFRATDGIDALFKAENVFPHVLVIDPNLTKMNVFDLAQNLLRRKERLSIVFLSPIPDEDHFVDEVVTGQVQFLSSLEDENLLIGVMQKALDWVSNEAAMSYRLRFLPAGAMLLREGEKGDFVYLLKAGTLKAYKQDGESQVELGMIAPGEFVGEMAYINGEPRSANVVSITASELIEMPIGHLDMVLFSKPAWSKALMKTLSKRLKKSNEEKMSEE
jgi:CheY-like chemotaxis protein